MMLIPASDIHQSHEGLRLNKQRHLRNSQALDTQLHSLFNTRLSPYNIDEQYSASKNTN